MIRIVSLIFFQVTLICFCTFGQGFTNREIYDFNVGDIFQRKNDASYTSTTIYIYSEDTIISRTISINNDSIIYSIYHKEYKYYSNMPGNFITSSIDKLIVTDLDSIAVGVVPTSCGTFTILANEIDTQYFFSESKLCYDSSQFVQSIGWFEGSGNFIYHKGLGLPDFYYANGSCGVFENCNLVYYRKNGIKCGTKLFLPDVGLDEISTNEIIVSPTLTNSILTIKSNTYTYNDDYFVIKIFDILGKPCYQHSVQNLNNFNLNISEFVNGIYFIEIQQKDKIFRQKIIKY